MKTVCVFALMVAGVSAAVATPDGFSLRGVVVDQTGAPIVNAQVFLYASPTLLAQTTTGGGAFVWRRTNAERLVAASGFVSAASRHENRIASGG